MEDRYVRVSPVNKELLASLVEKAKGPSRTMKQFADEIGCNPSTLSRIVNKQNNGASKDDLITAIALHADQDSGITLEMLMNANGMAIQMKDGRRVKPFMIQSMLEDSAMQIIMKALIDREVSIEKVSRFYNITKHSRFSPDCVLRTSAISQGKNEWAFEVCCANTTQFVSNTHLLIKADGSQKTIVETSEETARKANRMVARRVLDFISRILTIYCSNSEELPDKYSVVVTDVSDFEGLTEEFSHLRVFCNISIINIDMAKGIVLDEYVVPRADGDEMKKFFDASVTIHEEYEDVEDEINSIWGDFEDEE